MTELRLKEGFDMQACYCGGELKESGVYYSNRVNWVCQVCGGHYVEPGSPALAHPFPPYDNAPTTGGETFGVCKYPKRYIAELTKKLSDLSLINKSRLIPYSGALVYTEIDCENIALFFSYAWDHGEVYDYIFSDRDGKSITGTKIEITTGYWPGPEYQVFPKTLHRFSMSYGLDLQKFYPTDKLEVMKRKSFVGKAIHIYGYSISLPGGGTKILSLDPDIGLSIIIEYVPGMKPDGLNLLMQKLARPEAFYGSTYFPKSSI